MRPFAAVLFALCAAPLLAQAKEVDLAVAYPSTTLVYASGSLTALGDLGYLNDVLGGINGRLGSTDLRQFFADKVGLAFGADEFRQLLRGANRFSGAVVDVGLKNNKPQPKLQFVIDHKDLTVFTRTLRDAAETKAPTITSGEVYDGITIYNVHLKLKADRGDDSGGFGGFDGRPTDLLEDMDVSVAVLDNRYLVVGSSGSAVKDAIDGLKFPGDPAETLLGNKHYVEALKEYVAPDGLLFVNVQAMIKTIERVAGDKAEGPQFGMNLRSMMGLPFDSGFLASLTQYEQFKNFAAACWIPKTPGGVQARIEAKLSFHNAPGWLDALRAEPQPMPLLGVMPEDAVFATTASISDFGKLYGQCKEFVMSRAREAGKAKEVLQEMKFFDPGVEKELAILWKQLGRGQAFVVLPTTSERGVPIQQKSGWSLLLGVNDWRQAQEMFYDKVLSMGLFDNLRDMEGDLCPVDIVDGVEIHANLSGREAFAFIPDGKEGVLALGDAAALRRLIEMRKQGRTLDKNANFRSAHSALWEKQNLGVYVNLGSALHAGADLYGMLMPVFPGMWFDGEGEDQMADRDDAEIDRNPWPRLAEYFSTGAIVGGTRSTATAIEFRFAVAGVPPASQFGELAQHYRDVDMNFEVRDDLLRVHGAAMAHLVIRGEPATNINTLLKHGYLARPEWSIDPFGKTDTTAGKLTYLLAPVPKDVDARQAILLAYQQNPGLRGKHLAVLWNNHVVAMTPDQLKVALERAARGEALNETMYDVPLKPLHETPDVPSEVDFPGRLRVDRLIAVTIIDDDGEESTVGVKPEDVAGETEKILNKPASKEDE